jgi:hypothetical protein
MPRDGNGKISAIHYRHQEVEVDWTKCPQEYGISDMPNSIGRTPWVYCSILFASREKRLQIVLAERVCHEEKIGKFSFTQKIVAAGLAQVK